MRFIGRKKELDFLEGCYESSCAQLVIVYGRRRVGKTEMLTEFARGKQHVFFAAPEATKGEQIAMFSRRLFEAGAPAGKYISTFDSWHDALASIPELPFNGKKLVIIDEFPYLAKADSSLASILQNLWDGTLKSQDVMIVLCGSSMSFIEDELLAEKNPLYGRATGVLKLMPMDYRTAAEFFPRYEPVDQIRTYSILGGIPHYLAQFSDRMSLADNIKQSILQKGCALYSEVDFLLRQELRETGVYNSIIQAIALGATALNEIADKALVESSKASVYLKNLVELGIVEREFSVTAGIKETAKRARGLYRLTDNFFRFWYAFGFPNYSDLEAFDIEGVYRHEIAPTLDRFASLGFEQICTEWMRRQNRVDALPFRCAAIGRWWDKRAEIDIVGISKERGDEPRGSKVFFGECKFRKSAFNAQMLDALSEKSEAFKCAEKYFYLFSKGGFTKSVMERVDDKYVFAVTPEQLYKQ